jgi:hypothetical protein
VIVGRRPTSILHAPSCHRTRFPRQVTLRLSTDRVFVKVVGGPGFEPGASRSRNLSRLVHRERFQRLELVSSTHRLIPGPLHTYACFEH